jgi:hypothetical protein
MEHVWSLLCTKAIVDKRTNMVSLMDALDLLEVGGEDLPTNVDPDSPPNIGPTSIFLVTFWYRTQLDKAESGKFRIRLLAPNGRAYGAQNREMEVNLASATSTTSLINMEAIPYLGPGVYYFEVEKKDQDASDWTRVARLPLQMKTANTPS